MTFRLVILCLLCILLISCKDSTKAISNKVVKAFENANSADRLYDYKKYNRFILVKSDKVFASVLKIGDFAELPQEGNVYFHEFKIRDVSGWELIKVSDELDNYYFFNIAYWLLGYGDEDPNHADQSVIVLTDKITNEVKYLGLIDSEITKIDDSMLLLSDTNDQFIIEIPFHTYKTVTTKFKFNIKDFLNTNSLTVADFTDQNMDVFEIRFNEKSSNF